MKLEFHDFSAGGRAGKGLNVGYGLNCSTGDCRCRVSLDTDRKRSVKRFKINRNESCKRLLGEGTSSNSFLNIIFFFSF